eukprot:g8416.t3
MAIMVSSLIGALPKAHAFVGSGVRPFPKHPASAARWSYVTAAAATPTVSALRSSGALGRYLAGGAVATNLRRKAATPPPATASVSRGLMGSPLMFASAGGVMETAADHLAKHVLVPVADGSEEIESVTIIDTLVRAGAVVTVASVEDDIEVTCSRGVKIKADCKIADCEQRDWDAVVCPGGMPGAVHLKENGKLEAILKKQNDEGRIFGAICAAPAVVLASHGLLEGRKATCYPSGIFTAKIPDLVDEKVVVDGNLVTSQGPATSMAFALQLVDSLFGQAKAEEIADGLLFK